LIDVQIDGSGPWMMRLRDVVHIGMSPAYMPLQDIALKSKNSVFQYHYPLSIIRISLLPYSLPALEFIVLQKLHDFRFPVSLRSGLAIAHRDFSFPYLP
jgi:hypothetical protein